MGISYKSYNARRHPVDLNNNSVSQWIPVNSSGTLMVNSNNLSLGIYKAIPAIMREMGAVKKQAPKPGSGVNYFFRSIESILNELQQWLAEFEVTIIPRVIERKDSQITTQKGSVMSHCLIHMSFTLYHSDGSHIESTMWGEAFDTGDKASGKAASYAFKKMAEQVFCIPTEDAEDPDKEAHKISKTARTVDTHVAKTQMREPQRRPDTTYKTNVPSTPTVVVVKPEMDKPSHAKVEQVISQQESAWEELGNKKTDYSRHSPPNIKIKSNKITEKQRARLFAIQNSNVGKGWTEEAMRSLLMDAYGIESTKEIEMGNMYDEIVYLIEFKTYEEAYKIVMKQS